MVTIRKNIGRKFQISAYFPKVHSLMRVTVPSSSTKQMSTVDHQAFRRKVNAVPSNILLFGNSQEEGTGVSRLGDGEEQIFLLQPWRDRGSHDPAAQRQKEAEREMTGSAEQSRAERSTGVCMPETQFCPHQLQGLGHVLEITLSLSFRFPLYKMRISELP